MNLQPTVSPRYPLGVVDYTRQGFEIMAAEANQHWVSPTATSQNFPSQHLSGMAQSAVRLICFGQPIAPEVAQTTIEEMGFLHATLWQMLPFARKFPQIQKKLRIVAQGQSWMGRFGLPYFPILATHLSKRYLYVSRPILALPHTPASWGPNTHFLVLDPASSRAPAFSYAGVSRMYM